MMDYKIDTESLGAHLMPNFLLWAELESEIEREFWAASLCLSLSQAKFLR